MISRREHAVAHDALAVVHVVDEMVERGDALLEPGLDPEPLAPRDRARNDVERPGAIDGAILLVIDREGDAHRLDGELRSLLPHADLVAELGQIAQQNAACGTRAACRADQLVVQTRARVGGPVGAHC